MHAFEVTCSCFYPLHASCLCLSLARSCLFIHVGLLASLPNTLFVGMDCVELEGSDPWILLFWALLPSRTPSHRTFQSRSLKRSKFPLLIPVVLSLLFIVFPAHMILNSTISWILKPRLPLSIQDPTSSFLQVSKKWAEHFSSSAELTSAELYSNSAFKHQHCKHVLKNKSKFNFKMCS